MIARRLSGVMVHGFWRVSLPFPLQEQVTGNLVQFCDLPWDDACLEFHRSRRVVYTASAEQVRRPMYRSSIGRHRNYERYLEPLKKGLRD